MQKPQKKFKHTLKDNLSSTKKNSLFYQNEKKLYVGMVYTFLFALMIGISSLGYFNNYTFAQLCPEPNVNDRDGDSIPNEWETKGLDINRDNVTDI